MKTIVCKINVVMLSCCFVPLHSVLFILYFFCTGGIVTVKYLLIHLLCLCVCTKEIVLQQFLEKRKIETQTNANITIRTESKRKTTKQHCTQNKKSVAEE